jgi:uncharacterized membrane protein
MASYNRPVRALGHPIHQIFVAFPVALFGTAVVFDAIDLFGGSSLFSLVGYWDLAAGLIGAVLAAPFGLADWLTVPAGSRAKRVGGWHGIGNVVMVVLFFISWLLRTRGADHAVTTPMFVVEIVAIALGSVTAWLGGELVDRLGIGPDVDANPDAPSSLSHRPAAPGTQGRTAPA